MNISSIFHVTNKEAAKLPHYKHVEWDQPEVAFRMYISYVSLFFDLAVLTYHFSTPFHPKVNLSDAIEDTKRKKRTSVPSTLHSVAVFGTNKRSTSFQTIGGTCCHQCTMPIT